MLEVVELGVAREVVDVNNIIAVLVIGVPDDIKIEEIELEAVADPLGQLLHKPRRRHLHTLNVNLFIRNLREWQHNRCQFCALLVRDIGQRPALDALGVIPDDIDLEDGTSVVDKLLQQNGGLDLLDPLAAEHHRHLVRLGAAIGQQGLGNHRKLQTQIGLQFGGVVDEDLLGDGDILDAGGFEGGVDDVEHGDAVVEAGNGVGRVEDDGAGVERGEFVELGVPFVVVELVDDAVEGALLGQGLAGIHGDQIDAVLLGMADQRRLDEGLLFLRREGVADAVASPIAVGHFCMRKEFGMRPHSQRGIINRSPDDALMRMRSVWLGVVGPA